MTLLDRMEAALRKERNVRRKLDAAMSKRNDSLTHKSERAAYERFCLALVRAGRKDGKLPSFAEWRNTDKRGW